MVTHVDKQDNVAWIINLVNYVNQSTVAVSFGVWFPLGSAVLKMHVVMVLWGPLDTLESTDCNTFCHIKASKIKKLWGEVGNEIWSLYLNSQTVSVPEGCSSHGEDSSACFIISRPYSRLMKRFNNIANK